MTAARVATTAATLVYLDQPEKVEEGSGRRKGRGREYFVDAHGVTVKMMRTEEMHIKRPVDTQRVGRPSIATVQDHITIGFAILNGAIAKRCMLWQDIRQEYLKAHNARQQVNGGAIAEEINDRTWLRIKNTLTELWKSFDIPIVTKKRTATIEERRLKAQRSNLEGFFDRLLTSIHQVFPEAAEAARHLNGDESPGVRQPDKLAGTTTATVPSVQTPNVAARPKAPAGFSIWTTRLGSGDNGPVGILTESGTGPLKYNWLRGQLPPGLSQEWLADNTFFASNDTSDRMRLDLFLDICQNHLLPFHRKIVPEGPLLWQVTALCILRGHGPG